MFKIKKLITALCLFSSSLAYSDINMYGPGGPHTALKEAASLYQKQTGIKVNVNYGPQASWNNSVKKDADIIFGSSEQSALAIIRDHSEIFNEKDTIPLYLRKSIILVKKGNPKNIQSIEDLTNNGIGIIVNDGGGRSNTSGTGVWEDIAGRIGNINIVKNIRKNIILFAPNSGSARKEFETNPNADAWITWLDWAISNPNIGDIVLISPDKTIWRDMNITVRKNASEEVNNFAEWLQSGKADNVFYKYGWVKSN